LVPIRLDLEIEGGRYTENFCWNLNEPFFTPENLSKIISEENRLEVNFEKEITE